MLADITICIPVRNGEDYIAEAIKSILKQSYQNWQLIIKDNNSSDNTREIVKSFLGDSRIQLHERDEDIGAKENVKSCLREVQTEYFLILSHDDYLYSQDALLKSHDVLENNPDILKVHCDIMFVDAYSRPIIRRRFHRNGIFKSDDIAKKSILKVRNLFGVPVLNRAYSCDESAIAKDLKHTGDIHFAITVGRRANIYHIPEVLIALRFHKNNMTHRKFDTIAAELRMIALMNNIQLSRLDNLIMVVNDCLQRLQKKIFFLYIDYFRK